MKSIGAVSVAENLSVGKGLFPSLVYGSRVFPNQVPIPCRELIVYTSVEECPLESLDFLDSRTPWTSPPPPGGKYLSVYQHYLLRALVVSRLGWSSGPGFFGTPPLSLLGRGRGRRLRRNRRRRGRLGPAAGPRHQDFLFQTK